MPKQLCKQRETLGNESIVKNKWKNMERFTNLRVILAPKTGDGYG